MTEEIIPLYVRCMMESPENNTQYEHLKFLLPKILNIKKISLLMSVYSLTHYITLVLYKLLQLLCAANALKISTVSKHQLIQRG